jgi:hypothetical protein
VGGFRLNPWQRVVATLGGILLAAYAWRQFVHGYSPTIPLFLSVLLAIAVLSAPDEGEKYFPKLGRIKTPTPPATPTPQARTAVPVTKRQSESSNSHSAPLRMADLGNLAHKGVFAAAGGLAAFLITCSAYGAYNPVFFLLVPPGIVAGWSYSSWIQKRINTP